MSASGQRLQAPQTSSSFSSAPFHKPAMSAFSRLLQTCGRRLHTPGAAAATCAQPFAQPFRAATHLQACASHAPFCLPGLQPSAAAARRLAGSARAERRAPLFTAQDSTPEEDDDILDDEDDGATCAANTEALFQQLNLKLPQYCSGCGVRLQQADPDGPGYFVVPAKLIEQAQVRCGCATSQALPAARGRAAHTEQQPKRSDSVTH